MFTIKFIYPHGQEMVSGPYDSVHAEWQDREGKARNAYGDGDVPELFRVVHAYRDGHPAMTMGPIRRDDEASKNTPPANVFVMNANGATVAKYDL